ncbi:MAG: carbohydrate kinase family protein [Chloroflexota bacterium]|nr:carbohydrate kinase family protein [Chloroflexota bacterium]
MRNVSIPPDARLARTPYEVVGVGDADVDIYLDVPHLPGRDEKVAATDAAWYPGGMVANFLVALRRLGTPCCFHGPIGADAFGRVVQENFARQDVATDGLIVKSEGSTYYCVVLLDASGEKALVIAPTDCISPAPDDIDPAIIAPARHLHLAGGRLDAALRAVRIAKQHNLSVSLDLEPADLGDAAQRAELLTLTDLLFVNHRALAEIIGSDLSPLAALPSLLARGPRTVCVTAGAAGAWVGTHDGTWHMPAFSVPVVDSTGAGDTFAAAFVYGYRAGWPPLTSARFAAAAAALAIGQRGGHHGAPTRDAVDSFLAAHPHSSDRPL